MIDTDQELPRLGHLAALPALAAEIKARARIRDIPRSCSCYWLWSRESDRWHRRKDDPGCVWHGPHYPW